MKLSIITTVAIIQIGSNSASAAQMGPPAEVSTAAFLSTLVLGMKNDDPVFKNKLSCADESAMISHSNRGRSRSTGSGKQKQKSHLQIASTPRTENCMVRRGVQNEEGVRPTIQLRFIDNKMARLNATFRTSDIRLDRIFQGSRYSSKSIDTIVSGLVANYGSYVAGKLNFCSDHCGHTPRATTYRWTNDEHEILLVFMPYTYQEQSLQMMYSKEGWSGASQNEKQGVKGITRLVKCRCAIAPNGESSRCPPFSIKHMPADLALKSGLLCRWPNQGRR